MGGSVVVVVPDVAVVDEPAGALVDEGAELGVEVHAVSETDRAKSTSPARGLARLLAPPGRPDLWLHARPISSPPTRPRSS